MAQAASGDTVRVHYTGRLDDGTIFDSSEGREPLEFTLGSGQVIPGFEEAVTGMEVGGSSTITVEPEKAYGQRHEEAVQQVPRADIPADIDLEVGMQLQASGPQGDMVVTVVELSEDAVKLDANHPLAGRELTFDVELVEIA